MVDRLAKARQKPWTPLSSISRRVYFRSKKRDLMNLLRCLKWRLAISRHPLERKQASPRQALPRRALRSSHGSIKRRRLRRSQRRANKDLGLSRGQAALNFFEVRVDLRVALPQRFNATHGAHHRGVVAITKGASQFREAALQALPAQIHRHLSSKCNALVAIFTQQIGVRDAEVIAHRALDIRHSDEAL